MNKIMDEFKQAEHSHQYFHDKFKCGDRVVFSPDKKVYGSGRTAIVHSLESNFITGIPFLVVGWDDMGGESGGAAADKFEHIQVEKEHLNEYDEIVVTDYKEVIEI